MEQGIVKPCATDFSCCLPTGRNVRHTPAPHEGSLGDPVRVDRGLLLLAEVVLRLVPRVRGIAVIGGLGFKVMVSP